MMKKILFSLFSFLSLFLSNAQTKKTIDSINSISFNEKLKKAVTLDEVYLKNAQDSKSINYEIGEAESYSNLSLVYYYQGKYEKDLTYSLKAISIYEKLNNKEKLALEYGELGYRMKKRNMQKALYYMQKGMKIAEKKHFQKPILSIYNNYGVLKEMQGQLDSALYFYNKGLMIKEIIKDTIGIPYSLNNIAGVYVMRNQFVEAKKLYDRAIAIRQKSNDHVGVIENLAYYGDLFFAQKKYDKAIFYYSASNQNAIRSNYIDALQYNYKKLSECYELQGSSILALENYKQYSQFKDSLISKETNSKIAELEVKYDTNQKEKLLLQKEIENKRKTVWIIIIGIVTLFTALVGFLFFRQQKLKNVQQQQEFKLKEAIVQIENQNKLQEQRLSISRDLHDNIGAQLTFIISSVENLKFGYPNINEKIKNQLTKVGDFTRSTIIELRDTIWAMNGNEFTVEDLRIRMANFIEKAQSSNEKINFKFSIDDNLKSEKFSSLVGINIYRTIQEAVNNAMKYSNASEISVKAKQINETMQILVEDNGDGFDMETINFGNGLHNMKKRIEEIGGNFEINSIKNKGTQIRIELKIT